MKLTRSINDRRKSANRPRLGQRLLSSWFRRPVIWSLMFLGAVALGLSLVLATAGTENDFFQNAAMQTGTNYNLGTPTNVHDVLLTTSTTALTLTGSVSATMGSLNQTNNTAYTISNKTTTSSNSTLNIGGGGTTDSITGSNGSDLIFLGGVSSSLTIKGPNDSTGSGILNTALKADGNLNVANAGATLTISSVISGAFNISKIGVGTLNLNGANTFGAGKTFTLSAGTVTCGAANTIPSGTSLALNGGNFKTGATTGFAQSTGTLTLSDNSTIALGTGSHSITFTASNGVTWTASKTLTVTGWTGGYNGTSGTAGKILVGSTSSGLTASQLAEIVFFDGTANHTATILSTGEVVPLAIPLNGTYTVGAGGNYTTLTAAVADYVSRGVSGLVVFSLTDATYSAGETFPITIGAASGTSAVNFLTIKPASGASPTITGSVGGTSQGLITLNGASRVVIDGSNNGTTSRNLTITNTNSSGSAIRFVATADNDMVKNLTARGQWSGFGVVMFDSVNTSITNNTVQNCLITAVDNSATGTMPAYGVLFGGGSGSTGNIVTGNDISDFTNAGVYIGNGYDASIVSNNNLFKNNGLSGGSPVVGIYVNPTTGTLTETVSGNKIHDLTPTSGVAVYGIYLTTSTLVTLNATNNFILLGGSVSRTLIGIFDNVGDQAIARYYANSIYINGTDSGGNNSAGIDINGTPAAHTVDMKDNVVLNVRGSSTSGTHYGIVKSGNATNFSSDYNDIISTGTNAQFGSFGGGNIATFTLWKSTTGLDANSISADPNFTSTTDLHIKNGSGDTVSPVARKGLTIGSVTSDIDGDTRKATPDIGADEFSTFLVTSTAGANGSISPLLTNAIYNPGQSQSFTITPNSGFAIASVTDNSVAQSASSPYNLSNIQVDHTVAATFAPVPLKYRSKGPSGNWSNFNTWQVSSDGGTTFVDAVSGQTPTSADDTILIQSGHSVTVDINVHADQLTVDSPGVIGINSGQTLTIDDGTGTDLTVNGSLSNGGALTLSASSTTTVGSPAGILITQSTGTLTNNGAVSVNGSVTVFGGGTLSGNSFSYNSAATLNYNGPGAQTTTSVEFPASNSPPTVNINDSGGVTLHAARTISTSLVLTTGNFVNGGNLTLANGLTITRDAGTLNSAPTFGTSVNCKYLGSTPTTTGNEIPTSTSVLSGLIIINSGGVTLGSDPTVNSALTLNTGALSIGAHTLTLNGGISPSSGTLTGGTTSNITFGGSGANTTLPAVSGGLNNLTINRANGITSASSSLSVTGLLDVILGTFTSATAYNNVQIDVGGTLALSGPITVSGNWTNNGTFTPNGFGVTFDGAGAQTITTGGTSAGKLFAGFTVSKSTGTATLAGDLSDTALTITSGTFDQGASFSVSSGAVNITGGTWSNTGTGDLTLSGDVANAGTITFNGGGTGCPEGDSIAITSTAGQRAWSGVGTFNLTDVAVSNQGGTAVITVHSGTNVTGNGLNWIFIAGCSGGQYTWTGASIAAPTDWTVGTNWSPTRVTPDPGDVLTFDNNSSPTVTNIPTQTISKLRIIGTTSPQFSAAASGNTLTIDAGTGQLGFDVFGLSVTGSNNLFIHLGSGTLGTVTNFMSLAGGAHKLVSNDPGGITFPSPAIFSTQAGFSDFPFGDGDPGQGAAGSVIFQSGATYIHNAGSSPFGGPGSASIVTFQTGSTAQYLTSSGFDATGRTYANLLIGSNSVAANVSQTGSGASQNFQFDNLTVDNTAGESSLSYTGNGTITIRGNISSLGAGNGLADVTLTPGAGGVLINGGGTQTFSHTGNTKPLNFDGNVNIASGTTLTLSRILLLGQINSNSKIVTVTSGATLNAGSSGYVVGSLRRTFTAAAAKTFEVGTLNGYSQIELTAAAGGTFPAVFTASASATQLPHIHGVTVNALKRYWTLNEVSGSVTADLVFHYLDPTDIPTNINAGFTDANYILFKYDGSFSNPSATVNTSANTASITGVSSFSDWTLADPSAVQPGTLTFVGAPYSDSETNADHTKTITISRTGGPDGAVDVNYTTSDGTATLADIDYVLASGVLHWNDGETSSKSFDITVKGDTTYEANETVNITLSNPSDGATTTPPNPTTLTITNDDPVPASATLVVNTTADTDDGACTADPGGCTLREAINAANSLADANTINFNIPLADPGFGSGVFTIRPGAIALPVITRVVTIDGASQTAFTGDTNPMGPEVVINGSLAGVAATGLLASGNDITIKNLVVNGFAGAGIFVGTNVNPTPTDVQILNNYIGTDPTGTTAVPNGRGVDIHSSNADSVQDNLISGNSTEAVSLCDTNNSAILNNRIGTDRLGTGNLANGSHGVYFACTNANNNTVQTNTIAFNGGDGFRDDPDYRFGDNHHRSKLKQNSIFGNTGLGINLLAPPYHAIVDGVTLNDPQDPDTGSNNLQNFPVITSALAGGTNPISGTLNTTPNSASGYTIEFFSNTACDGTNGEGKIYLGTTTTGTTDGNGDVGFTFTGGVFIAGDVITATATDSLGNTSEFSTCFTAAAAPTLTVNKVTDPTSDTGKFNLQIDGSTAGTGADQGNGGTTGAVFVSAGNHTVSETAGAATTLSDYVSVISGDCAADGSVILAAGQNKFCTITNTRKPKLTVTKTVIGDSVGRFDLQINTVTYATNVGDGGSTGAQYGLFGANTFGETGGTTPATSLADYTTTISGSGCTDNGNGTGSITLGAGDNVTCSITNTKKPKLTVNKVVVGDTVGRFNLQINTITYATDVGNGGSTSAQYATVGANTFGETAGTGTTLTDYTTVISGTGCTDNGNGTGSITLANGNDKVCTITNTKKPKLTVTKVLVPANDPGRFDLQINSVTYATNVGDGGSTGAQYGIAGSNTFGETGGTIPATNLSDYTTVITGTGCTDNGNGTGTISLLAGGDKTCTITNTRNAPTCPTSAFVVTNTSDDPDTNLADGVCNSGIGQCSLRAAIMQANYLAACPPILIDATGVNGTIALTSALPAIDHDVTINGAGANALSVDGGGTTRVFEIAAGRTVSISGLAVRDGSLLISGGNYIGGGNGGGILNNTGATLTLTNSTVASSIARHGGGIYNDGGTLTVTGSTVSGNNSVSGVGINNFGGTLTLTNSTVSGNTGTEGGAILNENGGTATLINSTVSGNTGGGGVYVISGTVNVRNTIIAGNSVTGSTGPDIYGSFTSQGHNLVGDGTDGTGFTGTGDQVGTGASPINPHLAPLGDYGGPTQTHALLGGSPAIDAGDDCVFDNTCSPALGVALTTDQRGTGFPRKIDGNSDSTATVDIGAFEATACTTPPATPAASNDGPYCEGATIHLFTPTVAGATYAWAGPNGFASSDQNPTIVNATTGHTGTYIVTITLNGCTSAAGSTSVVVTSCSNISITKSGPASVTEGNNFAYTITVTNQSSTIATGIAVSDVLPAGVTFVSASAGCSNNSGTVTCIGSDIAASGNDTFNIIVAAGSPNSVFNSASASASNDPTSPHNSNSVNTIVNAPACAAPPAGMVAWYPGDGNPDDVKGGHNGTLQNGATFAAGKVNQAFTLNGTNQYVDIGDIDLLSTFTIDAWVYGNSFTDQPYVVSKGDGSHNTYYLAIETTGAVDGELFNGTGFTQYRTAANAVVTGSWQHLALTYDAAATSGQRMKIYVNGVSVSATASVDNGGAPEDNSLSTKIGIAANGSSGAFNGLIDEVELFNTAINATDVKAIYDASYLGKCRTTCTTAPPNMMAWFKGEGDANDAAGANNGAIQGGVTFAPGKVGQAFSFDGTSGEIVLPHTSSFNFGPADSFAIDAWLKPDTSVLGTQRVPVSLTYACSPEEINFIVLTDGRIDFSLRDSNNSAVDAISPSSILDGQWHHVAGVRDVGSQTVKLYLDGLAVASVPAGTMTGTFTRADGQNRIGSIAVACPSDRYFWKGQIDEVEVFNRALTQQEIAAIADAGNAGKCAIVPYTITASAGANGSISPSGAVSVNPGLSQSFNIIAANHYHVLDVLVDNVSVGAVSSYKFDNVVANHTISASFAINTYTIAASAGAGGLISPSGSVSVNEGSDQMFTITPDPGYSIANVTVDGGSVGAVSTYTFREVGSVHSISASFTINSYTITPSADSGGSISPSNPVSVNYGGSQLFTITPDAGHNIADVKVDGVSVGTGPSYTFSNVTANHTIEAIFAISTHTINATAGANGSINPNGVVTVNDGASQSFTITANAGYQISDVLVDKVSQGPVSAYSFNNVTADHTIAASFAAIPCPVSPIIVNTTDDNDDAVVDGHCDTDLNTPGDQCSLRAAIEEANAAAGSCGTIDINFDTNVFVSGSEIPLSSALPSLIHNVNITGPGADVLAINGEDSRIFTINSGFTVSISCLTLTEALAPDNDPHGGAVKNDGGTTTIKDCVFTSNSSDGDAAAIYSNGGSLTVNTSAFDDNDANGKGGAIYNTGGSSLTINRSTISDNSGNDGGGIYNDSSSSATITNSSIVFNIANNNGGGIYNQGTLILRNSTVSDNAANGNGGGIFDLGTGSGGLTCLNVTITANIAGYFGGGEVEGGGIESSDGAASSRTLNNSIVAGNFHGDNYTPDDIQGTGGVSGTYNLIGTGGAGGLTGNDGNQINVADPGLAPLSLNGGPTPTHALLTSSPAIDAGNNCFVENSCAGGFVLNNDQRGYGFKREVDGNADHTATVDIGAFEFQTFVVNTTDDHDDSVCDANDCSLREAINAANASGGGRILFNIPYASSGQFYYTADTNPNGVSRNNVTPVPNTASSDDHLLDKDPQWPHSWWSIQVNNEDLGSLPELNGNVFVDGYSQAGASPNLQPLAAGSNAVIRIEIDGSRDSDGIGMEVCGYGGSTIQGLAINQFNTQQVWIVSDGNTIQGNFIGTDVSGTLSFDFPEDCPDGIRLDDASFNDIGGGAAAQRNVVSGNCDNGILLNSSGSITEFEKANRGHANRTRPTAKPNATAKTTAATRAKSAAALKSGVARTSSAARASGSAKAPQNSEQPFFFSSSYNNIEGNYIGTDRNALQAVGNEIGIKNFGGSNNMIGCTVPEEANVIAGNNDDGILLQDISASANLIQGNFIGITPNGPTALVNDGAGVAIYDSVNNVIGFDSNDQGRGNTIAFNTGPGVEVETGSTSAGTGNVIRRNSIYSNGGLGIDLVPETNNVDATKGTAAAGNFGGASSDGVTPNDDKDPDTGANNLQNFPIITSATAGSIQDPQNRRLGIARPSDAPSLGPSISGTLNSTPGQKFKIDFYSNAECNSSPPATPYGEGQTWIGSLFTDPTDTDGNVSFVFNPVSLNVGDIITATATDVDGNTSEFSMCFVVPSNVQSTTTTVITNASSLSTTPSAFNAPFTVQWSVTPGSATGTVTVTIDGNFGCSDAVSAGQCSVTPSTSGTKTLVAHYGGDGNFLSSDSSPVTHTVASPLISGHVDYCITPSDNVPGVTINVTGSQTTSTTTDSSGNYSINLTEGHDYTLTPTKTALAPMAPGIDTADVVGAQRHFLGFTSLNGCALTAADADEDSRVDTVDAIAIQRFFLGSNSGTGHVGEWQFNPANRPYSNLSSSQNAQDYDALVVGDITGDLTPSIANRDRNSTAAHPPNPLAVTTVSLPIGNVSTNVTNFTLAVTTSNIDPADNLVGFQGDFTFDSSVVTFQATPASPAGLTASNWNVTANILGAGAIKTLRISAFSNTSTPLSGSGTLFNLNFTRVSNTVGANTPLTWAASPNNFVFIDTNLVKQAPGNTPAGSITIIGPTAANGNISGQVLDNTGTPVEGAVLRMSGTQNRLTITDAGGNYHFDDVETNGLYVLTPSRSNFTFSPVQRTFSQLGAHTEATFTGSASANGLNPLDTTEYFVRQQYLDFLGREPDDAGFNFWVNNIDSCSADSGCREAKRVDTSAAFFLSIEFQQTGYLVYRAYESAFGNLDGAPVPMKLSEFKPDTREISNGVVVLQDGWQQKLENNKRAFITEFVQRQRFTSAYPTTMTPAQFVDKLFGNARVPSTDPDYAAALTEFGAASDTSDIAARARVLRRVTENSTLTRQQFNQAFVLMQYFGYLQRDPNTGRDTDFTGYNFWLEKLNRFSGNFENAEMVKAFLSSVEYRGRFPR